MSRRHECAQRAAARLLACERGGDWRAQYEALRRTHPPDTPLRLLGTTPRQLARMLTDAGRASVALRDAPDAALAPGTIACVDLRPLLGGWPRLHWELVGGVGADSVELGGRAYARDAFLRAWACRASPFAMHRRALVVAAEGQVSRT